jgi:hypothetical protein
MVKIGLEKRLKPVIKNENPGVGSYNIDSSIS